MIGMWSAEPAPMVFGMEGSAICCCETWLLESAGNCDRSHCAPRQFVSGDLVMTSSLPWPTRTLQNQHPVILRTSCMRRPYTLFQPTKAQFCVFSRVVNVIICVKFYQKPAKGFQSYENPKQHFLNLMFTTLTTAVW